MHCSFVLRSKDRQINPTNAFHFDERVSKEGYSCLTYSKGSKMKDQNSTPLQAVEYEQFCWKYKLEKGVVEFILTLIEKWSLVFFNANLNIPNIWINASITVGCNMKYLYNERFAVTLAISTFMTWIGTCGFPAVGTGNFSVPSKHVAWIWVLITF